MDFVVRNSHRGSKSWENVRLSLYAVLFQAFTVVAVFNSMTFALKVTPLAVRALSEGAVAVKRFQVRHVDQNVTNMPQSSQKTSLVFVFRQYNVQLNIRLKKKKKTVKVNVSFF